MQDIGERDRMRATFAGAPGTGHLVEQLLGEREVAVAHGHAGRVAGVDAQLAVLGYTAEAKAAAGRAGTSSQAETRFTEAGRAGDDTRPPAGRRSRPRERA